MIERDPKMFPTRKQLSCADVEELIDSFLDGEMADDTLFRFEQHVERCEECQSLVSDCQTIVSAARTLADSPLPDEVGERLRLALQEQVGHRPPSRPKLCIVKS